MASLTREQVMHLRGQLVDIRTTAEMIVKTANGLMEFAEYIDPEKTRLVWENLLERATSLVSEVNEYKLDWPAPDSNLPFGEGMANPRS